MSTSSLAVSLRLCGYSYFPYFCLNKPKQVWTVQIPQLSYRLKPVMLKSHDSTIVFTIILKPDFKFFMFSTVKVCPMYVGHCWKLHKILKQAR